MDSACTWGRLESSHVLKAIGLTRPDVFRFFACNRGPLDNREEAHGVFLGAVEIKGRWSISLRQNSIIMQERIIQFLKESDGYISGEEMSQRLKMSRAAIWKHMQELRAQGYEIAAVPHLGYQLVMCPDKLLGYEIQSGLNTKIIGKKIIVLDTVTSTMDEAFRLGMENCPEGTVVCAEAQSKGRGRLGRVWTSPKSKGIIFFPLVLRPSLPLKPTGTIDINVSSGRGRTIESFGGLLKPLIKWPNDILFGEGQS